MTQERALKTYETASLAAGQRQGRALSCMISYEIAYRSYELRRDAELAPTSRSRRASAARPSMQQVVRQSYQPRQNMATTLGATVRQALSGIGRHPFVDQLAAGTIRGRSANKAHGRQFIASGTACALFSAVLIVMGM